jgi:malonyl-CoA O-methyltransferase
MSTRPSESFESCAAAFDVWAATYDTIDNPLIAQATVALAARAPSLAGARVLELGCGTGRNAPVCLAAGALAYVGVDESQGMLAAARRRVDDRRASWIAADAVTGAQMLVEAGARFDVILLCLVLEHVRAVEPVFAAAAAALQPGGRLLALELHPALADRGVGANFRVGEVEVRLPSFRHDANELGSAAARAGLRTLAAIDHAPTAESLQQSAKLSRYIGMSVLLEFVAQRD